MRQSHDSLERQYGQVSVNDNAYRGYLGTIFKNILTERYEVIRLRSTYSFGSG
jgi:hypothetical protein